MTKLHPMNELERRVVKMVEKNEPLYGLAKDILIDMLLREEEKKNQKTL